MIKISTSILNATNRIKSTKRLNKTNNDYLHIDVMDGKFVSNKQFTIDEINKIKKISKSPTDIHLMVEKPLEYIDNITNENINNITFHVEVKEDINNIINRIKELGCKVGLAINPNTDLENILPYINEVDIILIMSVMPGLGGQKFIPESLNRIKKIKEINPRIITEIDGGVNNENIEDIKINTDIAVVGSYIIKQNDYQKAINTLKN